MSLRLWSDSGPRRWNPVGLRVARGHAVGEIVSHGGILVCVALLLGMGLGAVPEQGSVRPCPLQVRDEAEAVTLCHADVEVSAASHHAVAQVVRVTPDAASHAGTRECLVLSEPRGAGSSRQPAENSPGCATGKPCSLTGQLAASANDRRHPLECDGPLKSSHAASHSPFALADKLTSGTPRRLSRSPIDPRRLSRSAPPLSTRTPTPDTAPPLLTFAGAKGNNRLP